MMLRCTMWSITPQRCVIKVAIGHVRVFSTTPFAPVHRPIDDVALPNFLHGIRDRSSFCGAPVQGLLSHSANIYENLMLEEALMRAADMSNLKSASPPRIEHTAPSPGLQLLVFSYINDPCVVIGRNQCVFTEVNVPLCRARSVLVARRGSGGGTVYHDRGNVNFTFVTHRNSYDPVRTIGILMRFIVDYFGLDPKRLTTTPRHDIFLDGLKISGSAMKLQKETAFHHCTLLVSSSPAELSGPLRPSGRYYAVDTKATTSVRSPVTSLKHHTATQAHPTTHPGGSTGAEISAAVVQEAFLAYACVNGVALYHSSVLGEVVGGGGGGTDAVHRNMCWEGDLEVRPDVSAGVRCCSRLETPKDRNKDDAFVDGVGRRVPLRSHVAMREEYAMLSSPEWIFGSMPAVEIVVKLSREGVHSQGTLMKGATFPRERADSIYKLLDEPFAKGDGTVCCRLCLDRGKVSAASWWSGGNDCTPAGPLCWFDAFLASYVVGKGIYGAHHSMDNVAEAVKLELERALTEVGSLGLWYQLLFSCASSAEGQELLGEVEREVSECDERLGCVVQFLIDIVACSFHEAGIAP